MKSAQYSRLSKLPDPHSFEVEPDYFDLDKILLPRPTRAARLGRWARRNAVLVGLVALFLAVASLYMAATVATRPRLGLMGPPSGASVKQAAEQPVQAPTGNFTVETDRVAVLEEGSGRGDKDQGLKEQQGDAVQVLQGSVNKGNTTLNVAGADVVGPAEKGKQAQPPPAPQQDPPEPPVPIRAVFYSGAEGYRTCRGHVLAAISLPKPAGPGVLGEARCYNFPGGRYSECASLRANKADGCVANVFAEPDCRSYTNTAAFVAENRAIGGRWRSVHVQCGVPEPDPATLGKPPMMDSISSVVEHDKAKGTTANTGATRDVGSANAGRP